MRHRLATLEDMRIRLPGGRDGVADLTRNVDERAPLVDKERHERVSEVVRSTDRDPGSLRRRPERPRPPVLSVVLLPELAARVGEIRPPVLALTLVTLAVRLALRGSALA